jgi:MFS family permease
MSAALEDGASAAAPVAFLWRRTCALGVAQIVSWGTLFYTIAVLGAAMRTDTGVSELWLFGSFTAGLFLSGIASPLVGREIDARGGRRVLVAGSVLAALASCVLGSAQGPVTVLAGWLLAGIAMAAALYDPVFATLHQMAGPSYRRSVTALTLFGGFASTVFWPLSQFLLDTLGWRDAFYVYAALQVLVCLPIHALAVPAGRHAPAAHAAPDDRPPAHASAFVLVAGDCALACRVHRLGDRRASHRPPDGDRARRRATPCSSAR